MNVSIYTKKFDLIKAFFTKTESLCRNHTAYQTDMVSCQKTVKFLQIEIPSLEQKQTNLYSLLNHKRERRGIFNGGGTFLKWVLGVADNDDLDQINDAIRHVEQDDSDVLNLMKDQIHVVRSTISNFNDSIESLKIHEETLNSNIAQLNDFLVKDQQYKRKNEVSMTLLSYLNTITYLVNELNEQLDVLMDAILFAKSNVIHPRIISPHKFLSELDSQIKYLKSDKTFPLPLEQNYAFKILEISKISCSYNNARLIFIIETPICDSTLFNLYRSLPLPVIMPNSNSYIYIQPSSPYIILSKNKMQYKQIQNLEECITVTKEDFLCESHTSYSTLENPICETILLTSVSKQIPTSCKTTNLRGNIYIWNELKFNQWLYVLTEKDRLTIICHQQTYDELIEGTGILTLSNECTGYSKLNKLTTSNKITAEYINIVPDIPISVDCCEEKTNSSDPAFHLNEIHLSGIRLDELRHATHELKKFETDLNHIRQQHRHNYTTHTNYFYTAFKVTCGIVALVITYQLLRCMGFFVLLANMCKCFDFTKTCSKESGCCVAIYNQCTNSTADPPIRVQPQFQIQTMRFNDLQRADSQSLYDIPAEVNDYTSTPRRIPPQNNQRRPNQRKSYHGYSLDD